MSRVERKIKEKEQKKKNKDSGMTKKILSFFIILVLGSLGGTLLGYLIATKG